MATSSVRDDATLVTGLERWSGRRVAAFDRAAAGWSSETVIVTWDGGERVVVRLPRDSGLICRSHLAWSQFASEDTYVAHRPR